MIEIVLQELNMLLIFLKEDERLQKHLLCYENDIPPPRFTVQDLRQEHRRRRPLVWAYFPPRHWLKGQKFLCNIGSCRRLSQSRHEKPAGSLGTEG